MGLPIKIIGVGPFLGPRRAIVQPNILFLGRLPDNDVAHYYNNCKALVFPKTEDFGIIPLGDYAAGRQVIAFKEGGADDTIIEGVNGLFFHENSVESLIAAVRILKTANPTFFPEKFGSML